MKKIKAQPLRESDWNGMEKQLQDIFFGLIFQPILDLLLPHNAQVKSAAKEMKNAGDQAVVAALKAGRIQYEKGVFSGDFNAAVSRELRKLGAAWNKTTKTFALPPDKVTPEVAAMARAYQEAAKQLHDELNKRLAEIESNLAVMVDERPVDAQGTVRNVQQGFKKSAWEALGATADLSEAGADRLAAEYTENIKPYIQKFSAETIGEIRQMVADNSAHGYRFDKLVARIQGRYEVSRTKAKFLAQQETAMLVSKHRRIRFEDLGVTRYIWRTSGKPSVREDHRKLNGREFLYSDPPVVDSATGRRGNPGEDFGCQCVDEPVLPEVVAA